MVGFIRVYIDILSPRIILSPSLSLESRIFGLNLLQVLLKPNFIKSLILLLEKGFLGFGLNTLLRRNRLKSQKMILYIDVKNFGNILIGIRVLCLDFVHPPSDILLRNTEHIGSPSQIARLESIVDYFILLLLASLSILTLVQESLIITLSYIRR